ncbi:unnamed protein product [Porites lobata]|uniref:BBSome-interacting protein 1 n=1 Tax=Porites lobata TaxID=104759 RepID=A0ABN8P082_9CNID|nr:unnamed protein product [Porites lobata]
MAGERIVFKEVLPKKGLLFTEQTPMPVLCKPKIMPMKSVTLEKLETMQKEAQEAVKRQEQEQKLHVCGGFLAKGNSRWCTVESSLHSRTITIDHRLHVLSGFW